MAVGTDDVQRQHKYLYQLAQRFSVEKSMLNTTFLDSVATNNAFKIATHGNTLSNPTLLVFLTTTLFNAAFLHIALLVSPLCEFEIN